MPKLTRIFSGINRDFKAKNAGILLAIYMKMGGFQKKRPENYNSHIILYNCSESIRYNYLAARFRLKNYMGEYNI